MQEPRPAIEIKLRTPMHLLGFWECIPRCSCVPQAEFDHNTMSRCALRARAPRSISLCGLRCRRDDHQRRVRRSGSRDISSRVPQRRPGALSSMGADRNPGSGRIQADRGLLTSDPLCTHMMLSPSASVRFSGGRRVRRGERGAEHRMPHMDVGWAYGFVDARIRAVSSLLFRPVSGILTIREAQASARSQLASPHFKITASKAEASYHYDRSAPRLRVFQLSGRDRCMTGAV
ncbi:hypothetical protein FKP32DRAFT_497492 [Trametes sanguinea]|nr:hypothetical protein FKP32DRAFT_497492 [Trametes sanguinea]